MKLSLVRWALFFALLSYLHISSQNDVYKFTSITYAQGLSQNSVWTLHQDRIGQMWIGTRDGLNKYDGETITVYKHEKNDTTSISNNNILSITEDDKGYIWVGTSFGLNKYDPRKDKFKTYFIQQKNTFLGSNTIHSVKKTSNSELWIGSASGALLYDSKRDVFRSIIENHNILTILETKEGVIYFGTTKGLLLLNRKTTNVLGYTLISGTETLHIQDLMEDKSGAILIATKRKGLLAFNSSKNALEPYFDKMVVTTKVKNVRKLLYDDLGHLWIATYHGLHISKDRNNLFALNSNDNDDKLLNDNFARTLLKDSTGCIWVGNYYEGIYVWSMTNKNFANITKKYSEAGLSFKVVSAIKQYRDNLVFATEGGEFQF